MFLVDHMSICWLCMYVVDIQCVLGRKQNDLSGFGGSKGRGRGGRSDKRQMISCTAAQTDIQTEHQKRQCQSMAGDLGLSGQGHTSHCQFSSRSPLWWRLIMEL